VRQTSARGMSSQRTSLLSTDARGVIGKVTSACDPVPCCYESIWLLSIQRQRDSYSLWLKIPARPVMVVVAVVS
jgi:hypothetical protein